ncbi:organic solvent ABC transporter ATP-binding protein [Flavihumibacter solisilvae]|uniref:Organic solvent ABC transporter ATP-binding protein n=2 Tax=Flavihumibacter solisilvae TaxID=1349421 RepID=A0A0C1L3F2_9BACT|nr:organic solvent ABC transporter ATP-binding protein [Flavihumibacter solisilvae]
MKPMEHVIEIKELKKSFGENDVLKGIGLNVSRGENVVIMGRSGEGKSVTIKCIAGLLTPDSGSLKVMGDEVKELAEDGLKKMRRKLGFVFQGAALYDSMTVRENLAFPLKKVLKMKDREEIERTCREVLEAVGLNDTLEKLPSELSGGMRKRVGLARTLIVKPEIILYDEPTTGLDSITSKEISNLILEMRKKYKTTSVIITHDLSCAQITGDRILILKDGVFAAEGTYEELENSSDEFVRSFFK